MHLPRNVLYVLLAACAVSISACSVEELDDTSPDASVGSLNQAGSLLCNPACRAFWTCTPNNVCVPPTFCMNGGRDIAQGETDIDCGGSYCPRCAYNKQCAINSDCMHGYICNNFNRCDSPCNKNNVCEQGEIFGICSDCRCLKNDFCEPIRGETCQNCQSECCPADMTVLPDFNVPPDLHVNRDLTVPPDLHVNPDLTVIRDLSVPPDLRIVDMTVGPDMAHRCADGTCNRMFENETNCCEDCGCPNFGFFSCGGGRFPAENYCRPANNGYGCVELMWDYWYNQPNCLWANGLANCRAWIDADNLHINSRQKWLDLEVCATNKCGNPDFRNCIAGCGGFSPLGDPTKQPFAACFNDP